MATRFWLEKKGDRHGSVVATARKIGSDLAPLFQNFATYLRMYAGIKMETATGIGVAGFVNQYNASVLKNPRVGYNLTKTIVDYKRAKVTATDIRPFAVTDGGSWDKRQRARKLTKFLDGLFYECRMRSLTGEVYRMARVPGTGVAKVYEENGRPMVEHVFPWELRVDNEDGAYGKPRTIIQVKRIHRDVLRAIYPKPVTPLAISGAKKVEPNTKDGQTLADMVEVYEAWHLRSADDADDGVHVICTDAGTLFEEEWEDDEFPFAIMRPDRRIVGFWGVGDAEDLIGKHYALNGLQMTKYRAVRLCSVPGYYKRRGSNVSAAQMTNDIGRIVEGDDPTPPQPLQTPPIPADLQQSIDELINLAYREKHINEMAAMGAVPAGLSGSGESQRVFADQQTEQLGPEFKEVEQFSIDVARLLIKCARRIHEREGAFRVNVPGKKFLETIDWADVDLADDEFDLQILPTSNLPKTLSGRLATIKDLLQAGMIDATHGRRLLDFPDLEQDTNLATALIDFALWAISEMLDNGRYVAVEPYQQFDMCVDLGRRAYLNAVRENAPEKRLELLRQWIDENAAKLQAQQPPPPAPGMPQGGPMGKPMAPPTSDLLPVNGAAA
jgi:hypothetical protein